MYVFGIITNLIRTIFKIYYLRLFDKFATIFLYKTLVSWHHFDFYILYWCWNQLHYQIFEYWNRMKKIRTQIKSCFLLIYIILTLWYFKTYINAIWNKSELYFKMSKNGKNVTICGATFWIFQFFCLVWWILCDTGIGK